ncbi:hypothetical protein Tco_0245500 [Tanacetum coccineum]
MPPFYQCSRNMTMPGSKMVSSLLKEKNEEMKVKSETRVERVKTVHEHLDWWFRGGRGRGLTAGYAGCLGAVAIVGMRGGLAHSGVGTRRVDSTSFKKGGIKLSPIQRQQEISFSSGELTIPQRDRRNGGGRDSITERCISHEHFPCDLEVEISQSTVIRLNIPQIHDHFLAGIVKVHANS